MINDASVVIGGGNWGIKEADVLGYKLINNEYYARDIDFANSTAAGTYTDSTGVVRRSPYNLATWSEDFSNVAWTKAANGLNANATTNPINGSANAYKIIPNTTVGAHSVYQSFSVTAQPYTLSFYAKRAGYTGIRVADLATGVGSRFDLLNGVLGVVSAGVTASMQLVSDGWYRCVITFTPTTGSQLYGFYVDQTVNVSSYAGNDSDGIFVWGAQLVEGTEALPYFPTTTRLNVPRIDYRNADGSLSTTGRLLLEPQRTNSIRNSSMVGAVAGTPGTTPTNWANINLYGLSRTIVAIGVENGLPYIDFRFNGTANTTENLRIDLETTTSIAASTGQVWSFSTYAKTISGTTPTSQFFIVERTSAGSFITQGATTFVPTSTLERFSATRTLSGGATVAAVQPLLMFAVTSGVAYDFTIRIAAPQMELGAYATTWIPTTTAAVTRNADTASRTGVSSWIGQTEGTLFLDFESGANDSTAYAFGVNDGTADNRILIYRGSFNTIVTQVIVGGVVQAVISTASSTANTRYKCAIAYKLNDVVFYVNGLQIGIDTSATIPACSIIATNGGAGTIPLYRPVNQAVIFPTRLDNATLEQLTTL